MDERVAHKECRQQREDDDECVEHQHATWLLKIVFAVKCQVECEGQHEDEDIDNLAQQRDLALCVVFVSSFVLTFEGFDTWLSCTDQVFIRQ